MLQISLRAEKQQLWFLGIQGNYPIKYEDFKLVESTEKVAVAEVGGDKTPI